MRHTMRPQVPTKLDDGTVEKIFFSNRKKNQLRLVFRMISLALLSVRASYWSVSENQSQSTSESPAKKKKTRDDKQAARKPLIVTNKERNLDGGLHNRTVEQEFLMREVNLGWFHFRWVSLMPSKYVIDDSLLSRLCYIFNHLKLNSSQLKKLWTSFQKRKLMTLGWVLRTKI